ncbi:hypothetical protein E2562_000207 [Oryza meyeriana var. granulata]|uniref:Retrotransposon gag domain-containing protein n=1 Tax=Oryza meyeriana var. granulata TaxID=110450 RepID=A0A6G1DBR4_9ORYZ|nr:hypothetical protein E2562_000207 [Oryza meyeriana var. granulata]
MKLDNFDGSSTPVQAAHWLSYVEDKMEAFEVLAQDRVHYGTQLLKGEAQIWWKDVQSARTATHGPLFWVEFVRQFERRFYPATFLDKMKLDLNNYVQDKKTVAEYEIGFNQIVCFVPHVAYDEVEKARQFRQGLKPAIRHVLGAFTITDFRSMVEQALGVEMQLMYTADLYKSSGDDGCASFFSRARAAYTSIPAATFRYSTGPYTSVWGLLVSPRHYSFDTRGSLGSCTGCSYCGSLFFD